MTDEQHVAQYNQDRDDIDREARRRRVLVLSDLWPPFPGGAETLISNVARSLAEHHDVHVLTDYARAQEDRLSLEVVSIGVEDNHAAGVASIEAVLNQQQPDVILTHHFFAYQFEHELENWGVPVVQLVLNTRRLEFAALAVYISDYVREQLDDAQPGDLTIRPWANETCIAKTHGDAVGFVKPYPHKGAELVYCIADSMPERQFIVLRGEWQDIEIKPSTAAPNVELMEPVDQMSEFYARCRLVIMPSISEDAGTVAQEATLNGLPCISSNVGGLVETNQGGVLLEPANYEGVLGTVLSQWVDTIDLLLDDAGLYVATVGRQRAHGEIEREHRRQSLVELADRISEL